MQQNGWRVRALIGCNIQTFSHSTRQTGDIMTSLNLSQRAATERNANNVRMVHADFDMAPFTIAWEITRACAYACVHCRADAHHKRDPRELTTREAKALIDRLAAFGNNPILIFTGGDPMMRPDLFELIAYAAACGLR